MTDQKPTQSNEDRLNALLDDSSGDLEAELQTAARADAELARGLSENLALKEAFARIPQRPVPLSLSGKLQAIPPGSRSRKPIWLAAAAACVVAFALMWSFQPAQDPDAL